MDLVEVGTRHINAGGRVMTEQPQETEGILKGGKLEPVARDDEFPPGSGRDIMDEIDEVEEEPGGPHPL
jgi:hypothetical protein